MKKQTTVIVTGCANGIGNYVFNDMLRDGYNVFGLDKQECSLKNCYKVDVSDKNMLKKTFPVFPKRVDAIVNVAGIYLKSFSSSVLDLSFDSNVKGVFNMSDLFFPYLARSKGAIINVSSVHAVNTLKDSTVYATTKGAVESMTRGLAVEYGEFGVRVNCLRLGPVDTSMLVYDENQLGDIPLKRLVGKKDISCMIRELIRNRSITGSVITMDCGVTSKLSIEM